jgi:hypothetical protein
LTASRRLAQGLARLASTAPGGTKWPQWTAPGRPDQAVAIVGFEGENVCGLAEGRDPEAARAALVDELLKRAGAVDG